MLTGEKKSANNRPRKFSFPKRLFNHPLEFWIILARGIFAIILGLVLLLQPEKTLPLLGNFMGAYWLTSGVISIRFGASGRRARRLAVVAGVIGVFAGIAMLGRWLYTTWIAEELLLSLLGVIILFTGLLHAFGGFKKRDHEEREWTITSFLLGLFEIFLGVSLIFSPLDYDLWVYLAASIWALLGGLILIGDALHVRRNMTKLERAIPDEHHKPNEEGAQS
jgi:uncharacterized membrane protein HdeD (DUF308 family)